jgi:hypothetical protein
VLQKSQKGVAADFPQRTKEATIAEQCNFKLVAGLVREFSARWRSPPHFYSVGYAHSSENLSPTPQKDFCNTIGT